MSTTTAQQIRPVIECFCQILNFYGFSPITPEIFRLAKFNRQEATIPLWRLLFEIIHFQPTNSSQEQIINKFNQTQKHELVNTIKSDLFIRGYTYQQFLLLDDNMNNGSQQLLICLGWLIHQMKLIEKCTEQTLKSDSILDHDDTSLLHKLDKNENEKYASQETDVYRQVKQAMRVNSRLRFGLRRLHGIVIENANLQHQIHECHNMSSLEAHLCQHSHLLSHYMIELENEYQKLNLFLFWNENEHVFWKWMESVFDQTMSIEQKLDEEEDEAIDDKYEQLNHDDNQRLNIEKQKFHAAIDTLDKALARIEQLWMSNNDDESIEQDVSFDHKISSVFNELLATNRTIVTESNTNSSLFLHKPYQLVYAKKTDPMKNATFIKPEDFDKETKLLTKLQNDIDERIEKQRAILDTISHQFQNVMIV